MFDKLTFVMAYWLLHKPLQWACMLVNRLSLLLFWLSLLPVRPWLQVVQVPANINKRGDNA